MLAVTEIRAGSQVCADSSFVLVVEPSVDILIHKRCLSDAGEFKYDFVSTVAFAVKD